MWYIYKMRTTVRLNNSLLTKVKNLAAERGTTITALIDEGLRYVLSLQAKRSVTHRRYVKLKVIKGSGVREGVNLENNAALLNMMDSDTPAKKDRAYPGRK